MNYTKLIGVLFIALMLSVQGNAQMTESYVQGPFLIRNATIHTVVNGNQVADLRISGDSITEIGQNLTASETETVIDATGNHVYPGFIDGGTSVGMREVGSISLTIDTRELGQFTPHMNSITAVNPNSVHIPVTRLNGITNVIVLPSGGMLPGKASLIQLFGYTPSQMDAGFQGVVLNYPSKPVPFGVESDKRRQKNYEENLKKLDQFWKEAVAYNEIRSKPDSLRPFMERIPQYDAMMGVLSKEQKLMVNANRADDIVAALSWLKEKDVDVILMGCSEGWRVSQEIAESQVPVIIGPVLSNPTKSSDRYDRPYTNAAILAQAGITVCLRTNESANARNLPFNAGFAAAYGMGVEEALKAVTINPAKVFGLEDQLGSIEVGKKANLFISTGDPFETKSQIVHLFISGWKIPMVSRQSELYDEFLDRQPGLELNGQR